MNSSNKFVAVMGSYAIFLAPLSEFVRLLNQIFGTDIQKAGLFHCDYYLVRKQRLSLRDLYIPDQTSSYWFFHGFNW